MLTGIIRSLGPLGLMGTSTMMYVHTYYCMRGDRRCQERTPSLPRETMARTEQYTHKEHLLDNALRVVDAVGKETVLSKEAVG